MPSKVEIAKKTELSRPTIHKHLKDYSNHPLYLEQTEQFRIVREKVLAKVFKFAVNGDIKAAKLFLEFIGNADLKCNTVTIQNNYIQINQIKITQKAAAKLSGTVLLFMPFVD